MGILKRAKLVLACAALAAPFSAAAVAMPATALAQPVVSAQHAARAATVSCRGGENVESKTLTVPPGNFGTVILCYNPNNRMVWAKVGTSNLPACDPTSDVGCGTATVQQDQGGSESRSCTITRGNTICATVAINDANIKSIARATVIVEPCTQGHCRTASGTTSPPF